MVKFWYTAIIIQSPKSVFIFFNWINNIMFYFKFLAYPFSQLYDGWLNGESLDELHKKWYNYK